MRSVVVEMFDFFVEIRLFSLNFVPSLQHVFGEAPTTSLRGFSPVGFVAITRICQRLRFILLSRGITKSKKLTKVIGRNKSFIGQELVQRA